MDRHAIEDLGVDVLQLMEVAGLESARIIQQLFPTSKEVSVLTGPGGNGGDALVCAKWLKLWGYTPAVILSHEVDQLKPVTRHQLTIWQNYDGKVAEQPPKETDVIIDGLLGYSQCGDPRGKIVELIAWANDAKRPIVALDVPSGLDVTTGTAGNPCITAQATATFGVLKSGLATDSGKEKSGDIYLVDIGFPGE
jgi:hydroxyethylthiazole kinase-like uncharacterized protein yjeF